MVSIASTEGTSINSPYDRCFNGAVRGYFLTKHRPQPFLGYFIIFPGLIEEFSNLLLNRTMLNRSCSARVLRQSSSARVAWVIDEPRIEPEQSNRKIIFEWTASAILSGSLSRTSKLKL